MDNPVAYKSLLEKVAEYGPKPFRYSTQTIPIRPEIFDSIVSLINQSGYWSLPRESDCEYIPTDGAYFTLEANTPDKYKIVGSAVCPNDFRKFTYACQQLVKQAGLGNKIDLIWKMDTTNVIADTTEIPLSSPDSGK